MQIQTAQPDLIRPLIHACTVRAFRRQRVFIDEDRTRAPDRQTGIEIDQYGMSVVDQDVVAFQIEIQISGLMHLFDQRKNLKEDFFFRLSRGAFVQPFL